MGRFVARKVVTIWPKVTKIAGVCNWPKNTRHRADILKGQRHIPRKKLT